MIRFALCLLAAIAFQAESFAEVTKLPAKDRESLQNASEFHELRSTTNLPSEIFKLCADGDGRLADIGQKWEETDVITDSSLPRKRLVWAVTNDEYFVLHYESGGYAHNFHILVTTSKPGETKPKIVWRGVGTSREHLKNFSAFLDALKKKDLLDDRLDYGH